jgi:hypothetical protein
MNLRRTPVLPIMAIMLFALVADAREHPLTENSIGEAYSLARRNNKTMDKFLAQYFKRLPQPQNGPYISDIEIQTPYVQVVWRVRDNPMVYSKRQAEKDYGYPFDEFLVRVRITFTPTYPAYFTDASHKGRYIQRPGDFWREFKIHVLQENEIATKDASFTPTFTYADEGPGIWTGGDVTLKFDGSQLNSDPMRVEVLTPDGQTVKVKFNLITLR